MLFFFSVSSRLIFSCFSVPFSLPVSLFLLRCRSSFNPVFCNASSLSILSCSCVHFPLLYTELVVHFLHYGFFDFSREIFIIFLTAWEIDCAEAAEAVPLILYIRPLPDSSCMLRAAWLFSERNHYLHAVREHRTDRLQLKPLFLQLLISLNCSTSSLV